MQSGGLQSHTPLPLVPFCFETNPPSPFATTQSPFFRLPREIRDEIYDCVWTGSRTYPHESYRTYDFFYGAYGNHWRWGKLPRGTLACKLLLAEALEQYYSKVQCLGYSDYREECAPSPFRFMSLHRVRKVAIKTYLYRPDGVVRMRMSASSPGYTTKIEFRPQWAAYKRPHLSTFIGSRKHEIKDLSATFKMPDWVEMQQLLNVKEWDLDLSEGFIQMGTSFERVEFRIEPTTMQYVPADFTLADRVLDHRMMQFALESLARYLVGGGPCFIRRLAAGSLRQPVWGIEVQRAREGEATKTHVTPYGTIGMVDYGLSQYVVMHGNGVVVLRRDGVHWTEQTIMLRIPSDEDLAKMSGNRPGTCHYVRE